MLNNEELQAINHENEILKIMKKNLWEYNLSDEQLMKIGNSLFSLGNICFDSYLKTKNNLQCGLSKIK